MKYWIGLIGLCALIFLIVASDDHAQVLIFYRDWVLGSSVRLAVCMCAVAFLLFYGLIRFFSQIFSLRARYTVWKDHRQVQKEYDLLIQALIAFFEQDVEKSQKIFLKGADNHAKNAWLWYLLAAYTAHARKNFELCETYTARSEAAHTDGLKPHAIALTQAAWLLERGESARALLILKHIQSKDLLHHHPFFLKLLLRSYVEQSNFIACHELLPLLDRYVERSEWSELKQDIYCGLLNQKRFESLSDLEYFWKKIPNLYQNHVRCVIAYAHILGVFSVPACASFIERALENQCIPDLVDLYVQLIFEHPEQKLCICETWHQKYPLDLHVLLALGRLSYSITLWGQARLYFEKSLKIQPTVLAYGHLLSVYRFLDDSEQFEHCIDSMIHFPLAHISCPSDGH